MNRSKPKAKKSGTLSTVILILVFLVGLSVLCYPSVSNWWNSKTMSRAVATYDEAVAALSQKDYTAYYEAAEAFNAEVQALGSATAISVPDRLTDYLDTLDITGTGIMGYVTIEKLGVELPIYHGTSSSVLAAGAGHLEGTTLPIGGESTHAVISAHRGLPTATLFTHLDQLELGDTFYITVLDEIYTYEVDQISIVLPDELEDLYIIEGEDHVTLMTCTPYGINTHRLLVRGVRIDTLEETHIRVTAEAYKVDPILIAPILAAPLLLVLLVWLVVSTRKKNK